MKKLIALLLALVMVLAMAACSSSNTPAKADTSAKADEPAKSDDSDNSKLVGVAMPTKDLQRWNQDGENMKAQLEAAGYDVVEPATNCISEYIHMVQTLLDKGCAYLAGGNVYFDTSTLRSWLRSWSTADPRS